jgi:hypothetical protein
LAACGKVWIDSTQFLREQAMNRHSITLISLGLLAGCAAAPPPPLTADDPASPSAPEAPVHAARNTLGTDGLTRKSRQILAQTAKEQQQTPQGESQPSPAPIN